MKKSTLHFGEFKQYDKVFITTDTGVDTENVTSVAFEGETLYITQPDCLIQYNNGNVKKLPARVSKLFTRKGTLYAATGNALAEIKNGKIKACIAFAQFNCLVIIGLHNP